MGGPRPRTAIQKSLKFAQLQGHMHPNTRLVWKIQLSRFPISSGLSDPSTIASMRGQAVVKHAFSPSSQVHRLAELPVVRSMCYQIRHRGPDDEGYHLDGPCALGMRPGEKIVDVRHGFCCKPQILSFDQRQAYRTYGSGYKVSSAIGTSLR